MTAGMIQFSWHQDCDEVNLKEQTLDDELKVYCVFHSDLEINGWFNVCFNLSGSPRRRPVRQLS